MRGCKVYLLPGLTDYWTAWRYQKALAQNIHKHRKEVTDSLLLLQHHSIYTLGRGSSLSNVKFKSESTPHEIVRVERGGEVTWHGPGQLVAYPVLDLSSNHKKDLHWFANALEEVAIRTISGFGVTGGRSDVNTGVWVGMNKISAIGVTASRWITMHGSSLNIDCDMTYFDNIVPCGIKAPGRGVCRLRDCANTSNTNEALFDHVQAKYLDSFADVFSFDEMERGDEQELADLLEKYPELKEMPTSKLTT